MFIALGLTFLGMALGFLLRGKPVVNTLTRCVMPAIMLLLFCLGISVGGNDVLMQSLPRLGGAALALTGASIAGSLAAVACIRRFFRQAPAPAGLEKHDAKSAQAHAARTEGRHEG